MVETEERRQIGPLFGTAADVRLFRYLPQMRPRPQLFCSYRTLPLAV